LQRLNLPTDAAQREEDVPRRKLDLDRARLSGDSDREGTFVEPTLRRKSIYRSIGRLSLMFITSRSSSQLRELISLADRERNNPEVILLVVENTLKRFVVKVSAVGTTCGRRGGDTRRE
jgi:hypothetical protein